MDASTSGTSRFALGPARLRLLYPLDCDLRDPFSILALLLPTLVLGLAIFLAVKKYLNMQHEEPQPFPFLDLPRELRDMVYEHLVEDPVYPPPRPCKKHVSSPWSISTGRQLRTPKPSKPHHQSNWAFIACKQVYTEYMDLLRKRSTFHMTVSPHNYKAPSTGSSNNANNAFSEKEKEQDNRIWNISPETMSNIRHASLKLVTTSAMLGVTDPRNMTSADWTLGQRIRAELSQLTKVKTLTLDAKALGDPLWNPLWIWFHASQAFKDMGTEASTPSTRKAPKLSKICFSLDTWSPGENYVARDEKNGGVWTWYCMKGHAVGVDGGEEMTVREFCGKLYQECRICRPDLEESEDDEV